MCWRPSAARRTASRRSIAFSCGTGRSTAGPTSRPLVPSGKTQPSPTSSESCTRALLRGPDQCPGNRQAFATGRQRKISRFSGYCTPLSPDLQTLRDQSGAEAAYEQFVRSFVARYPRLLTVLDARRGAYPPSLFIDQTHLNGHGAIALSRAVATTLKPLLARPRSASGPGWIAACRALRTPRRIRCHRRGPRTIAESSPWERRRLFLVALRPTSPQSNRVRFVRPKSRDVATNHFLYDVMTAIIRRPTAWACSRECSRRIGSCCERKGRSRC